MSKKTLNKANLEALGAAQLADLLLEVSTGSADIKRRLRLELSHNLGASELAHDVRKRLASLRKSTSFVSWRKRKALVKDLTTQQAMITDKIGPDDPGTAFGLLWEFVEIAPSVYARVDDSKGEVGDVFREALPHFADLAPRALLDPVALAERVWGVIADNGFGEWDGIIALLAPTLGDTGLARLKAQVEAYAEAPAQDTAQDHEAIQFLRQLRGGASYAQDRRARFVRRYLQEIAEATGDTQAYIAQYSERDLTRPDIAAEVAGLLLGDGQAEQALEVLQKAEPDGRPAAQAAWDTAYITVLTALDQVDTAQAHRWTCFEATLNPVHLRAYLKLLPDFDDVEAEDRAKRYVLEFPHIYTALRFCLTWPDLLTAAQLVEERAEEIDGDVYDLLTPAAEALRERHPLAATLLWRSMIDFALRTGRAARYGHAADHFADCQSVEADIEDFGRHPTQAQYHQSLQDAHPRKFAFWDKVHG